MSIALHPHNIGPLGRFSNKQPSDATAGLVLMLVKTKRSRLWVTILYFIVSYGTLFCSYKGDYFCTRVTGPGLPIMAARLALACTLWELFASTCGALAVAATKHYGHWRGIAPLISTLVAGLGFASIPFWLYRGFANGFLFQNTWADVSCFFTELGNGLLFLFVVTPILTAATLLCELLILDTKAQQQE
jgi:heme/copper-type cytochrome/quinol oxidase subunit 3